MKIYKILIFILLLYNISSLEQDYLISVIMAIYNTGRYLDESINSLINQTINYQKIQIILVNDGSTDNTEEICLEFQNKFKYNIKYIKINHGGVSLARNVGMKYAKGKYINFLDPDDKWDSNAFKYFIIFFKFYKNVDIVAGRLKFFEATNNYHPLDYKFYKTRIVNLTEEYNCIHLSASSSFFKKISLKKIKFKEDVFSGEDTRFINNMLLVKPIMGLIKEAIYLYRRRSDSSSTVQIQKFNRSFYFDTINSVENYLINRSKILYNITLPFIQFFVGYDVLFRIKSSLAINILDNKSYDSYCLIIEKLLKEIDDKYILEQKIVSYNFKLIALSKKYHKDLRYDITFENNSFKYFQNILFDVSKEKNIIVWRILDIRNNYLHLEGKDNLWFPKENYFYYCKIGNKTILPKYYEYPNYDVMSLYGIIQKGRIAIFDIPLEKINKTQIIMFYISYN